MASVYFDLDGTLVEFDRPFGALFADACRALDVDPTDDLRDAYSERFFESLAAFDDDPYRVAAEAIPALRDAGVDPGTFAATLVDHEVAGTRPRPGAPEVLDRLAGGGHALGVLTNGVGPVQRRKLDAAGLGGLVDDVYVPFEDGLLKPDPAVFETAKARLPGDRHVLVGDSREHDVDPAREAGFAAVHVDGDDPLDALLARHLPELLPTD